MALLFQRLPSNSTGRLKGMGLEDLGVGCWIAVSAVRLDERLGGTFDRDREGVSEAICVEPLYAVAFTERFEGVSEGK